MKFQYNVTKMPQDNLIEKRGFCGIFQEETMYLVNALNVIDEVKKAVIGKDSCKKLRKQKHNQPETAGKNRTDCKLCEKCFFYTVFVAGTKVITHDWLSALAYSLQR